MMTTTMTTRKEGRAREGLRSTVETRATARAMSSARKDRGASAIPPICSRTRAGNEPFEHLELSAHVAAHSSSEESPVRGGQDDIVVSRSGGWRQNVSRFG